MKTTLQELLEAYDKCKTLYEFNDWLCDNEKRLLEKEKEQIINAVNFGCSDWGSGKDTEQYYNQTYNQQ
jgi:hypothetical protein